MTLLVAFGMMNMLAMVVLAATVLAEFALSVVVVFGPGIGPGPHDVARSGLMGGM